ncbi:hypothetical protein B0T09DRAFT_338928 [Sordaria sp. MPI-SDFR-AT-0083]|nr:hypothetical protein B0T09DRAFT_338928 [Sordaria sp. MPI-SDFR-AT-0083]
MCRIRIWFLVLMSPIEIIHLTHHPTFTASCLIDVMLVIPQPFVRLIPEIASQSSTPQLSWYYVWMYRQKHHTIMKRGEWFVKRLDGLHIADKKQGDTCHCLFFPS